MGMRNRGSILPHSPPLLVSRKTCLDDLGVIELMLQNNATPSEKKRDFRSSERVRGPATESEHSLSRQTLSRSGQESRH